MSEDAALVPVTQADLERAGFGAIPMAPGLAIFFNDALYTRCKQLAQLLSQAEGVIPKHLIGKPSACFAVISRAITWNLDPVAVMGATYQTPNGNIGYEGKLISAILENSGRVDGNIKYELVGEWDRVRGKFKIETSQKGNKYPASAWKPEDEEGLGVIVSARVKGEKDDRSERYMLNSFYPRNSTLWALRPEQQIKYAACRAFANTAMPGILFGIPFDVDPSDLPDAMKDITPRPQRERNEFVRADQKPEESGGTGTGQQESASGQQQANGDGEQQLQNEGQQQPGEQQQTQEDQQPSEQVQQLLDEKGYEQAIADLVKCDRVPDVADLRKKVALQVDGKRAAHWDAACDARTNAILTATAKPRAKR